MTNGGSSGAHAGRRPIRAIGVAICTVILCAVVFGFDFGPVELSVALLLALVTGYAAGRRARDRDTHSSPRV